MLGMRFSPTKSETLIQDWLTTAPKLVIGSEEVECIDRFTHLESFIRPDTEVSDEILARIQKA